MLCNSQDESESGADQDTNTSSTNEWEHCELESKRGFETELMLDSSSGPNSRCLVDEVSSCVKRQ